VIRLPQHGTRVRMVTGYWFDPVDPGVLTPELAHFIAQGGPVVSIGFGSMVSADPGRLREVVVTACRAVGIRAVLIGGAGAVGLDAPDEPDVITTASVPHSALFPRMDANVHHGGAGTTANAFAAGVPTVIVPFGADQPFWARRATDLGVAPDPVPVARLTTEALTRALRRALTDPSMRSRSAELGTRIRSEDGTGTAAQWYGSLSL